MKTRLLGIAALAGLTAGLAGIGLADEQTTAAEAAAKAAAATPEGKTYEETVGRAFGREHGSTVGQCAKGARRADLSDFDLLLRMEATGVVEEVLVKPRTNLASCVQGKVAGWKVLAPPHAGFWVKLAVNLKRN